MSKRDPVTIERLVDEIRSYMNEPDIKTVLAAFNYAKGMHKGQMRESGQPYVVHPLEVAFILATIRVDITSIVAGLLHDVIEDTPTSYADVSEKFGENVASLVEGVTKLEKIEFSTKEEQQVENLRKMFFAMAKDIRVVIIKLADRLHNMRTLQSMTSEKQLLKAHETLQIYAPLANRLGMSTIRMELEDLSLRYLDAVAYYEIVEGLKKKKNERDLFIDDIIQVIEQTLVENDIECTVSGRAKHIYSIFKKMFKQNKSIDEIYDLFAVRIIVETESDCYACLGIVHDMFRPIPGRFKDYIASPKTNSYQSLHSTVVGKDGQPFEIQIRTKAMHETAEHGIAAHWKYKEGNVSQTFDEEKKLEWLRKLLEIQQEMVDADEFMHNLKVELFVDEVFVFTPKGDVVCLPANSTVIDFAFAIHSAVGYKMMGAKVNGRIVTLEHTLMNGDVVEILTSSTIMGPRRDWLNIVKTASARSKIRSWFKKETREENIARGLNMLMTELRKQPTQERELWHADYVNASLKRYGFSTVEDLYATIGYGGLTPANVIARLRELHKEHLRQNDAITSIGNVVEIKKSKNQSAQSTNAIIVKDVDNCLTRISRCCTPIPGDPIVGYITKGRGVTVHRADCPNVTDEGNTETKERLIECEWSFANHDLYLTEIQIEFTDKTGILTNIVASISDFKIPVRNIVARSLKGSVAQALVTVELSNLEQLDKIIKRLLSIGGVFSVRRI